MSEKKSQQLKLQLFGQHGTLVGSSRWAEAHKAKACGESADGTCNGYRKRLVDDEGNVYFLQGAFVLSKAERRNRDGSVVRKDQSVTSRFSLVRVEQTEDGERLVSQVLLNSDDIVRQQSPAAKRAARSGKTKEEPNIDEMLNSFPELTE